MVKFKRIILGGLGLCLCFSLTGCGKRSAPTSPSGEETPFIYPKD